MFGKWAFIFVALACLWGGVWLVKVKLDELGTVTADKARLEQELKTVKETLAAERLAAKLNQQEDKTSYSKAAWSCQNIVRGAVAATKIVKVPVKELVYVKEENGAPVCDTSKLPDLYRLRDVEDAFYAAAEDRQ
jgi:hypothetical protein